MSVHLSSFVTFCAQAKKTSQGIFPDCCVTSMSHEVSRSPWRWAMFGFFIMPTTSDLSFVSFCTIPNEGNLGYSVRTLFFFRAERTHANDSRDHSCDLECCFGCVCFFPNMSRWKLTRDFDPRDFFLAFSRLILPRLPILTSFIMPTIKNIAPRLMRVISHRASGVCSTNLSSGRRL